MICGYDSKRGRMRQFWSRSALAGSRVERAVGGNVSTLAAASSGDASSRRELVRVLMHVIPEAKLDLLSPRERNRRGEVRISSER